MFLKTKSKPQVTCEYFNLIPDNPKFFGLSETPVSDNDDILILFRDDGFTLFSCIISNYARVVYKDGILALTNEPEPTPQPKPEPGIDPITQIQLAVAELAEVGAQNNINNKLAIAELAEIVAGGK